MSKIHQLVSQDPMTFNELLDLFDAYVATIEEPLNNARNLIREYLEHPQSGDINFHVIDVMNDADDMAARLKQIRTLRNTGTDVQVALTLADARIAGFALQETTRLLSDAESALDLLQSRLTNSDDFQALSVIALSRRALRAAEEHEFRALHEIGDILNKAMTHTAEGESMEVDRVASQLTAGGAEQQSSPRHGAAKQG